MKNYAKFAAFLLAAAVLTGCTNGGEIYPKSSSRYVSSASTSSSSASTSSSSTTTSTSSSTTSSTTSSSTSSSSKTAYVPEIPTVEENVFVMSFDPQDGRKIEFDGLTAKITGKIPAEGFSHIETSSSAKFDLEENGDEFTATVTYFPGQSGFTTLRIYEKSGNRAIYRLKISGEKVGIPDRVGVAEKNATLVDNSIEMPLNHVAAYITFDPDPEKEKSILREVKQISDSICEGISEDYDKLRAISNWVAANIYYDNPAFNRGVPEETLTLEYVLKNRASVCGGFSNITAALAAAQGIEIYNIHGFGASGACCFEEKPTEEVHEWNCAVIGGRLVWLDPDFDSRNTLNSSGVYQSGAPITKFFDINGELLALTHRGKYAEHRDYFALLDED